MKKIRSIIVILIILRVAGISFAAEPAWTKVLAGDIVAGPVIRGDRVYVSGTDRTVTCLDDDGSFLWSRPIPGRAAPFLRVLDSGIVLAASGQGTLSALNADGLLLWRLESRDLPVADPFEGRDGRILLVYANRIVCVSVTATVKWAIPLGESPAPLVSETGSGDILVLLKSSALLRVSPFGRALERIVLPETPLTIVPTESGFACGFPSGYVRAYDVRDGRATNGRHATELLWERRIGAAVQAIALGEGTLCALSADGVLSGINVTDGSPLWSSATGHRTEGMPTVKWDYGQFNAVHRGYACARTLQGSPVWDLAIASSRRDPALGESGVLIAAEQAQSISAFHAETRVIAEKKAHKAENYAILNGSSSEYGTPFAQDRLLVDAFIESVSKAIIAGSVGDDEISYARRLTEIVSNRSGAPYQSRDFDPTERARAASVLGRLGSSEYRAVLLDAFEGERDPTVLVGLLYGLSALGPDIDGAATKAVDRVARATGINESSVNRAACDALYSIVRYTGGKFALEGVSVLSRLAQSPYGNLDREYARKVMGNILQ